MVTATLTRNRITIAESAHRIQHAWSSRQRRQRFIEGQRRFQELVRLIDASQQEPEVWAAGALTVDDLQRIAG